MRGAADRPEKNRNKDAVVSPSATFTLSQAEVLRINSAEP